MGTVVDLAQGTLPVNATGMPVTTPQPVGRLLREWRQRRRMSQLELACEALRGSRGYSLVEPTCATVLD